MSSCAICERPALFRCGKCKRERYCSRACQKDHWSHHKTRCAQLAAAASASAPPAGLTEPGGGNLHPNEGSTDNSRPPADPVPPSHPPSAAEASIQTQSSLPLSNQPPPAPQTPTSLPRPPTATPSPSFRNIPRRASRPASTAVVLRSISVEGDSCAGGSSSSSSSGVGAGNQEPQPAEEAAAVPQPATPPAFTPRPPSALAPPRPPPGTSSTSITASQLHPVMRARVLRPPAGTFDPAETQPPEVLPPAAAASSAGLHVSGAAVGQVRQLTAAGPGSSTCGSRQGSPGLPASKELSGLPSSAAIHPSQVTQGIGGAEPSGPPTPGTLRTVQMPAGSNVREGRALVATAAAYPVDAKQPGLLAPFLALRSSATPSPSLADLPPEVLLEVLKALPARSLAVAGSVCRSWRRATREPWLWVRHMCACGYAIPAGAYVQQQQQQRQQPLPQSADLMPTGNRVVTDAESLDSGKADAGSIRAVPGVRGIRAVRAVRAAGGDSHEDFLGGLRLGFLDRQGDAGRRQHQEQQQHSAAAAPSSQQQQQPTRRQPQWPTAGPAVPPSVDLKGLFGRTVRTESNWRNCRYAESQLREHSSNVECLAFQTVEPWGPVLLSAAWDGSVRVFSLGPSAGTGSAAPQQVRCVRRYRGHTGWITCMAAGRHQVVTASTDHRVAAWRYYSESSDPWVTLEHPQEVTLVRFCYAPPPEPTTDYLVHHLRSDPPCEPPDCSPRSSDDVRPPVGGQGVCGCNGGSSGPSNQVACTLGSQQASSPTSSRRQHRRTQRPYNPQWEDWVVTGCVDGAIRLWHLPTKQMLRVFAGHTDVVWGMTVLHGSSVMVSSSRDGSTRLWHLPAHGPMQDDVESASATTAREAVQPVEAVATLSGHSSAILCMDTLCAAPGLLPSVAGGTYTPAGTVPESGAAAVSPVGTVVCTVGGRPVEGPQVVALLAQLLHTDLLDSPPAGAVAEGASGCGARSAAGHGGAARAEVPPRRGPCSDRPLTGDRQPAWLVATGGADGVVRVWNLATVQCQSTLRGHSVGVLSVTFGYLPRWGAVQRDQQTLPPDLDVSAAASAAADTQELALPPGQYGRGYEGARGCSSGGSGGAGKQQSGQHTPASQRLVLVTGSVREVRVWDPVLGTGLAVLDDHSGPVTSLALVHGALVTLAMNDGLIVYKCNGLPDDDDDEEPVCISGYGRRVPHNDFHHDLPRTLSVGREDPSIAVSPGPAVTTTGTVAAPARRRCPLEPVICMQDTIHRSFAAALAVQLEGLAVGSGTGDITYLDFRARASPLPVPSGRRQQQLLEPRTDENGAAPYVLRF